MGCLNMDKNLADCNCSYDCAKKGLCCECVRYHRTKGQMPGCYFPAAAERTYDRSIEYFIKVYQKHKHL